MAKPRAQTLQQRFGFADKDLTTPKHDEIMLWLDENITSVIRFLFQKREWGDLAELSKLVDQGIQTRIEYISSSERQKERCRDELNMLLTWKGLGEPPVYPDLEVTQKQWEYPITERKYQGIYTIGFIDMCVWFTEPGIFIPTHDRSREYKELPTWNTKESINTACFEIKSSIPSLGEVIRQIRMYQTYLRGTYVIVSPDDRFADALRAQGIEFYKYPGDVPDIWDRAANA